MEFWDSIREGLQRRVNLAKKKAGDLRREINVELRLHDLRKSLKSMEAEREETYCLIGKQVHSVIRAGGVLRSEEFGQHLQVLEDISKRIRDIQSEINCFYELPSPPPKDEVEVQKDKDGGDSNAG